MKKIKVWDGAIRLFHWGLVIAFCLSAYSAFQDKFGMYADMHTYAGAAVLVLVIWRILWGVVGSETAQFRNFIKGPKAITAYLKGDMPAPPGHNPLGAVSVFLMLMLLLMQAGMGLFASDGMFFSGPLTRNVDSGFASDLTRWHRWTGYSLLALAAFHLLAVLWYQIVRRTNLIWPMITGSKFVQEGVAAPAIRHWGLSVLLLALVSGAVWYLIFQ